MTRRTSIEAFNAIMENGLLGKRQEQAYEILYIYGPLTSNQIWEKLKAQEGVHIASHGAGSRLSELRDLGVVAEVGTTIDPFTKMRVILWDVTDQVPTPKPDKETKDQVIARQAARIAELEKELLYVKTLVPRQTSMFGH